MLRKSRRCGSQPPLVARLRTWWDFKRGRFEKVLARIDPLGGPGDPPVGVGVREPRRPLRPSNSGSIALDLPDE
jgi:hypothetical protein